MKSVFMKAWGYQGDAMNLPVPNVDEAIPFYESVLGFKVDSRGDTPHRSAVLARDDVKMRLAENGGDSSQDGCFFEVDNIENAYEELKANGLSTEPNYRIDENGGEKFKVFFVVAPDGLCYCLGERLK